MRSSILAVLVALLGAGCHRSDGDAPHADGPPVAAVIAPSASTVDVWSGDAVAFAATCSDPDGGPVSQRWQFEGGTPATSDVAGPTVTFATAGSFGVTYWCTDGTGLSSGIVTRTIVVAPIDPLHWYVDSRAGDDRNDGAAPSRPLRTLAAVLAKAPPAGSTISLARGGHWREQLAGLAAGTTVEGYGTGERPLVDASDVAPGSAFVKTPGRTNVYEIVWEHELDAPGKVKHSAWEGGARLLRVSSVEVCDATAGSFFAPTPDAALRRDTIYVHPSGSTDPRSDGKTYELARRKYGVWGINPGIRVIGIHTRRNGHNDGSLGATYARDSICEDGTTHNCWNAGLFEDVTAWRAEGGGGSGSWTMFVHYTDGAGPGVTYRRCRAIGSIPTGGVGFYSHTGSSGVHSAITYDRCFASMLDSGFGGANAAAIAITDSSTYRVVQAITASAASVVISGGIFNGWETTGPYMTRFYSPGSPPGSVHIRDVTVVARASSGALISATPTDVLDVQQSTFAFRDYLGFPFAVVAGGTMNLTWRNNVVAGAWPSQLDLSGITTLDAASNYYSGAGFRVSGTSFPTLAAYKVAVAPQDADSLEGDPQFVGSIEYGDARISESSPARSLSAGAQLSSATRYDPAYWTSLSAVSP